MQYVLLYLSDARSLIYVVCVIDTVRKDILTTITDQSLDLPSPTTQQDVSINTHMQVGSKVIYRASLNVYSCSIRDRADNSQDRWANNGTQVSNLPACIAPTCQVARAKMRELKGLSWG